MSSTTQAARRGLWIDSKRTCALSLIHISSVESVVLVSKGARISRPKVKIDGLDRVIKSDHLRSLIEREIDRESVASSLLSMTKVIGSETLEELARQIAGLHLSLIHI